MAYGLAALSAFALASTLVVRPAAGLLFFAALIPVSVSLIDEHFFLETLFIVAATTGLLLRGALEGRIRIVPSPLQMTCLLFSSYMLVHVLLWLGREVTLRNAKLLAFYVTVPLLTALLPRVLPRVDPIGRILRAFLLGGLAYYAALLVAYFVAPQEITVERFGVTRLLGLGGTHPAYMVSTAPMLVAAGLYELITASRRRMQVLGLLTILIGSLVVTLSASRAGVITVVLALMLALAWIPRSRLPATVAGLVATALAFWILATAGTQRAYTSRFTTTLPTQEIFQEVRWLSFRAGMDLLAENPVTGIGLGRFGEKALPGVLDVAEEIQTGYARKLNLWMVEAPSGGNSVYLAFAVETGLLGLSLFVAILLATTGELLRLRRKVDGDARISTSLFSAAWIAFMLHIGVTNSPETSPLIWLTVALASALSSGRRHPRSQQQM